MTFRVGQKVVCISEGCEFGYNDEIVPQKGQIYTVREVLPAIHYPGELVIRLVEIVNRPRQYRDSFTECSFRAVRFRSIVEKKTDISFAHEILREHTKKIGEKA